MDSKPYAFSSLTIVAPQSRIFSLVSKKNCNKGDILLSGAVEEERYREYSFRETAKPCFLNSSSAQK